MHTCQMSTKRTPRAATKSRDDSQTSKAARKPGEVATAGMSEIVFVEGDEKARSVVGSCIALTLFHKRSHVGALAHIVLPNAGGRVGPPGKFADTAVPFMIQELKKRGVKPSDLVAKLCGGASMFGEGGPMQIGNKNADEVLLQLEAADIRVAAKHLAGKKGRRVTLDCKNGVITIEVAGQRAENI